MLVATVTISPTPLGVNRPSAMPPRSQVGSVARPSWRNHSNHRSSPVSGRVSQRR